MSKKLKNEKALLKEALNIVIDDAVRRGVVEFEATDSHDLKIEYAYRLLVHDGAISPLPNDQLSMPNIRRGFRATSRRSPQAAARPRAAEINRVPRSSGD